MDTTEFKERFSKSKKPAVLPVIVIAVIAGIFILIHCFYTQDIGEVIVLRNWDGKILGSTTETGLHVKSPLVKTISYDVRNMLINFYSDADYAYNGGSAQGPDVTINDKSGAKADIDIQVVYSLDPNYAETLYKEYGTQTNYTQSYLSNDVRSVARETSGKFDTITMLTDRGQYTDAVEKALTEKWADHGLTVEQVSVQDVRYPDEITSRYATAQAAEIDKQNISAEEKQAAKDQLIADYAIKAENVENTRTLAKSAAHYTVCLPYTLDIPADAKVYKLSGRSNNELIFSQTFDRMEALQPTAIRPQRHL